MSARSLQRTITALIAGATALTLLVASAASAQRGHGTPIPRCSWVPSSLVQQTFNLSVQANKPAWATQIAPVLTCSFSEIRPALQTAGQPIVSVQFRELQRFKVNGFRFVRHLGSCVEGSSCPKPHKPAWVYIHKAGGSGFVGPYVDLLQLRVEDGLNAIVVTIQSPFGSLPVTNELTAAKQLARALLPHFRYR